MAQASHGVVRQGLMMNAEIKFEINGRLVPPHQLNETVESTTTSEALSRLAERLRQHLAHMRCPIHNQSPLITVVMSPSQSGFRIGGCCEQLIEQTGQAVKRLFNQTARLGSQVTLTITVQGGSRPFIFEADLIEELVIGRFDPDTGMSPDIDLLEHNAYENGVSRQHAAIVWRNGALNLVDKGTPNGTFLNGKRLTAHQPHLLRDQDTIRLGRLVLEIRLDYPAVKKSLLS
jgi:hypothetical protein